MKLSRVSLGKDILFPQTRSQSVLLSLLEGRFDDALNEYSEAIYCDVPNDKKAIYYNNRALVNLKMENYAIALFGKFLVRFTSFKDATDAIKHNPKFVKAFYRRGSA